MENPEVVPYKYNEKLIFNTVGRTNKWRKYNFSTNGVLPLNFHMGENEPRPLHYTF